MQFGHMRTDTLTVLFEQCAALCFRVDAALPQGCVTQHFPNRHPGRFETIEKFYPGQDRCVVVTLTRLIPVGMGKQPDPLIVTDGVGRKSRTLRQFANLHPGPSFVTTQRKLRVGVHSKSRAFFKLSYRGMPGLATTLASLIFKRKSVAIPSINANPEAIRPLATQSWSCRVYGFTA